MVGYKVLLLLHLLSVVIGFGPWMLNGLLPRWALGRSAEEGQAVNGAAFRISNDQPVRHLRGVHLRIRHARIGALAHDQGQPGVGVDLDPVLGRHRRRDARPRPARAAPAARRSGRRATVTQRLSVAAGIINLLVIVADRPDGVRARQQASLIRPPRGVTLPGVHPDRAPEVRRPSRRSRGDRPRRGGGACPRRSR